MSGNNDGSKRRKYVSSELQRAEDSALLNRFFAGMGLPMPQSGLGPEARAEREAIRDKELKAAQEWLDRMGMPDGRPEDYVSNDGIHRRGDQPDEYFETWEGGRLVFLDKFGCALRITPHARHFESDNPHALKPLFRTDTPNFCIELFPGIHCPVTLSDTKAIVKMLGEQYGIRFKEDEKRFNFGFLPGTRYPLFLDFDNEWITIDPQAAKTLSDGIKSAQTDMQEQFYGKLRDTLRRAWEKASTASGPDTNLIRDFWQNCKDMKAQGKLLAAWTELNDPEPPSSQIFYREKLATAAKAYAPRLEAAGPQ